MTHAAWAPPDSEEDCAEALYALDDSPALPHAELQRRLQAILDATRSHVACWRVALIWARSGGDDSFARKALTQSEDFAHGWVDYSGEFDDFEEEDSWRGRLAQAVAESVDDEAWVARLAQEGLAEDEFLDHLYDDVRALCGVSEPLALAALRAGARERLTNAEETDAPEVLEELLQAIVHLMPTPAARAAILAAGEERSS